MSVRPALLLTPHCSECVELVGLARSAAAGDASQAADAPRRAADAAAEEGRANAARRPLPADIAVAGGAAAALTAVDAVCVAGVPTAGSTTPSFLEVKALSAHACVAASRSMSSSMSALPSMSQLSLSLSSSTSRALLPSLPAGAWDSLRSLSSRSRGVLRARNLLQRGTGRRGWSKRVREWGGAAAVHRAPVVVGASNSWHLRSGAAARLCCCHSLGLELDCARLALECGIPPVLDGIVSAAGQQLGNG